jgi:hypothetical protein
MLNNYCLLNLPDPEVLLTVSVGEPSFAPTACESASAAVCDESLTVPNWLALPVIIGESASTAFGLWPLQALTAIPAQRHTAKSNFFMVSVCYLLITKQCGRCLLNVN